MNIAYSRKSTESEERQVLSIPAQVAELQQLAARRGELLDRMMDESRSAREPGRPVFDEIVRLVERGQVDHIYVWNLDRLARNPVDGGLLIHHLGHRRIKAIVTPGGVFTGTGNDKLMMQIHFGMATKYVDDLAENVRRGNRELVKRGRLPGRPPIGYLKARDANRHEGAADVRPDPDRFPLVRKLWEMLLSGGHSVNALTFAAQRMGLRTRKTGRAGDQPVSPQLLRDVFGNPFYAGQVRHRDLLVPGQHEPMITMAEFEQAQKLLGKPDAPRTSKHVFTYTGFARCGACGLTAIGERHVNRHGAAYIYYRCSRKGGVVLRCREPYVSETAIDQAVDGMLGRLTVAPEVLEVLLAELDAWAARQKETALGREAVLRKTLAAKERERENLTDLIVRGVLADDDYLARKKKADLEIEQLRAELHDPVGAIERWHDAKRKLMNVAATAQAVFRDADLGNRRELLGNLGMRVTVKNRHATINIPAEIHQLVGSCSSVREPAGEGAQAAPGGVAFGVLAVQEAGGVPPAC